MARHRADFAGKLRATRAPELLAFLRGGAFFKTANLGWPRHSARAAQNLTGFLEAEWCEESCTFPEPDRCQKSCRFLRNLCLSLQAISAYLAQNPWRSPRNDAASYSTFCQETTGPVAAFFLALQLFLFKLAKSLPHARYAKIEKPIVSARRSRARGQRPNGRNDRFFNFYVPGMWQRFCRFEKE